MKTVHPNKVEPGMIVKIKYLNYYRYGLIIAANLDKKYIESFIMYFAERYIDDSKIYKTEHYDNFDRCYVDNDYSIVDVYKTSHFDIFKMQEDFENKRMAEYPSIKKELIENCTITIDGKEIEISEESYNKLKESLV